MLANARFSVGTCRYPGTTQFYPHIYETGTVDLQDEIDGARMLTSVAWTAQTGAGYGNVAGVYYQSSSGVWTQIGGANPTSPLTGTYIIPAGLTESVRFALSPKADALQSETPTLQTAVLEIAQAFSGSSRRVIPVRLGPKLLPLGVL